MSTHDESEAELSVEMGAEIQAVQPQNQNQQAALGASVGRGASWMVAATVLTKIAAFVTQILLGWWLTKGDFAVFGVTIALSGFVQIFRDGGVREVLVQRGPGQYRELSPAVFGLAGAMNLLAAVLMGLAAASLWWLQTHRPQMLSETYADQYVPWMLAVIAITLPLNTPAAVLQAKLRLDLKFDTLSHIAVGSALVRNGGTILLAWWLKNPLAFVLPLLAVAMVENVWSYLATRDAPWMRGLGISRWKEMLASGIWMIVGSLSNILLDVASFGVIGLILSKELTGDYFFSYNWIANIGTILGFTLQQVLFSALARLKDEPVRFAAAVRRAQGVQMMLGAAASLGVACVMEPLEHLLWHGKWSAAVPAVMILGLFFAFRVTFGLSTAVLLARGQFKKLAGLTAIEGAGVVGFGAIGAIVHGTVEGVAWWTGGSLLVTRVLCTIVSFRPIGIGAGEVLRGMFPAWILACMAAVAAVGLDRGLTLPTRLDEAFAGVQSDMWRARCVDVVRMIVVGGVFAAAYAALCRVVLPDVVREVCQALPGPIGRLASRVMRV
jgi:O-antigen/teichoic acid export membrane protein